MINIEQEKQWNTGCLKFIGVLLIVVLIIAFFVYDFKQTRENRSNCDQVGGEYRIVGEEYVGKMIVDIYGCVK